MAVLEYAPPVRMTTLRAIVVEPLRLTRPPAWATPSRPVRHQPHRFTAACLAAAVRWAHHSLQPLCCSGFLRS